MSHFEALTPAHVPVMTALHALSFERPWSEVVFCDLLKLPTHMGFIGKDGFILCSVVMDEAEILTFLLQGMLKKKKPLKKPLKEK